MMVGGVGIGVGIVRCTPNPQLDTAAEAAVIIELLGWAMLDLNQRLPPCEDGRRTQKASDYAESLGFSVLHRPHEPPKVPLEVWGSVWGRSELRGARLRAAWGSR